MAQGWASERTWPEERDPRSIVRAHYSPFHPMRMVGVIATCEGSQGDGGAVAEGDGEHCSKVR